MILSTSHGTSEVARSAIPDNLAMTVVFPDEIRIVVAVPGKEQTFTVSITDRALDTLLRQIRLTRPVI